MTFQNQTEYWTHEGGFSVELTAEADTSKVPSTGATVEATESGQRVVVPDGRIKQMMHAIQLYALEQPFYWGYSFIRCIRRKDGGLLWVNKTYREEITQ